MYAELKLGSWREAVEQAAHLKALGQTRISLGWDYQEQTHVSYPWEFVTECEGHNHDAGYGVDPSLTFVAEHPSGLVFSWRQAFGIRDGDENVPIGGGVTGSRLAVEASLISEVALALPVEVRKAFAEQLLKIADVAAAKLVPDRERLEYTEREIAVLRRATRVGMPVTA